MVNECDHAPRALGTLIRNCVRAGKNERSCFDGEFFEQSFLLSSRTEPRASGTSGLGIRRTVPEADTSTTMKMFGKTLAVFFIVSFGSALHAAPIHDAAGAGEVGKLRALLSADPAALEAKDSKGNTPLIQAAQNGRLEAVKFLLEKGADVDGKDNEGTTPLMVAAMNDHVDVMKLLMKKGASIAATTNAGFNSLMFATDDKRIDAMKLLLDNGAGVDTPAPADAGLTPLMHAASNGQLKAVNSLLEKGASLEAKDKDGWSPLFAAAQAGQLESVELLLAKGALIDSRANDGSTPLMFAAYDGRSDVVRKLVEKGADVGARDHQGNTAFMLSEGMDHKDVVEFLRAPTEAAIAPGPAPDEGMVLYHLIDRAATDGFASLRGENLVYYRSKDPQWTTWSAVTTPVGAQDCVIDWNSVVGDTAHAELRATMLITKNHDEAMREFLRVRDVVARVVTWKDVRHGKPAEDNFRMFFEPHSEGKPHRTVVVRFDQNEDANGAYFVQLQIDAPLAPSRYRQMAEAARNNFDEQVKSTVTEFLAAAAQGFESYKKGDPTTDDDGLRRWESSRLLLVASSAEIQQRGETVSYYCVMDYSPYRGEVMLQYKQLVSEVASALPDGWSKAENPPFAGEVESVEFVSTDGTRGQIWVSGDSRTHKYSLNFQIVSNQRASTAPAIAVPPKSPSGPASDDDDPIGSGGFITPETEKNKAARSEGSKFVIGTARRSGVVVVWIPDRKRAGDPRGSSGSA